MSKNIFFTKFSEVGDRLDPSFHIGIENIKANVVKKAKYKCKNIKQLCTINRGRFGHRPRNDPRFYGGKYPFIQTGDIVNASINNNQIKYKQTLNELGLKTSKLFSPPKLLFTIAANIGDTAILDYQSCFPDSIVALIPKDKTLTIEYLNIYFKIIKPYIVALAPYAAQKNINNQQLSEIPIVVPPIDIQNKIILKMKTAYKLKEQKEKEAQIKLDSIENYLLNELDIETPSNEKESLEDRVFFRKFSDVSGYRFDSSFNSVKNNYYKNIISKYQNISFSKLNQSMQTGLPIRKDYRETNGKYPYYGANGIIGYMNEFTHDGEYLIIGQDGYIGNHYVVNGKFWASNHNWVIKLNNEVNIYYIKYFLDIWNYDYLITGGVIPKITKDAVNSIKIPLPLIEIQNKIVNHIQQLRDEAKALKDEAMQFYKDTKKEVEDMILGELNEI